MVASTAVYDYVIVGGGTAGCALASKLSQALPDRTIAIVETGPNAHHEEIISSATGGPRLHFSEYVYNYATVPQRHLYGRQLYQTGGKVLSGSSAVNYGCWVRGHAKDYDHWSKTVGDGKWGYEQLLPGFKRSETHFDEKPSDETAAQHGFDGPIHLMMPDEHPMRELFRDAFDQVGAEYNPDTNGGNSNGYSLNTLNWHNYARQPSGAVHDLSKVTVLTKTRVNRILFNTDTQPPTAVGIQTGDGTEIHARREVIVSCGAIGTPHLLMLSGLGDASTLKPLNITSVLDNPEIGKNLHDHITSMLLFTLKHPEKDLAMGTEKFIMSPAGPREWVYSDTISSEKLAEALAKDDPSSDPQLHRHVKDPSIHFEMLISYAPAGAMFLPGPPPPMDGSIISVGIGVMEPTARGTISLISADPAHPPAIDPNYMATEHDMCVLRESIRQCLRLMETPAASQEVAGLYHIPGVPKVGLDTSDEILDEYIRKTCITWFHPAGTAAMGTVVDSSCKVMGVQGLRVVDTSIFPFPLTAHYQAPIYGIADRAAQIIAKGE